MTLGSSQSGEFEDLRWVFPVSGQLGPLREFSRLRKLKAPIAILLGWSPNKLLPLAEVVPTGLTYLGLTEEMFMQCTCEWDPKSVLKELAAFLSVWRSVTPDLQVMEVWTVLWLDDADLMTQDDAELMTQMQKLCEEAQESGLSFIVHHEWETTRSSKTFQWVRNTCL
jgi:hypothetical protein